ncbi:VHL beta domain-containing protein [Enhygromyxa salina]|uniref:VHL beta domain-containing protein n=1 Tax=Enhygromyxa salina TaxID=215803 RepID=UPI000D0871B1|nr:hypothetical protein [Enhygromyxa salina]
MPSASGLVLVLMGGCVYGINPDYEPWEDLAGDGHGDGDDGDDGDTGDGDTGDGDTGDDDDGDDGTGDDDDPVALDCTEETTLESQSSMEPTSITFINGSGEIRKTYWLNYQGKRVAYATLAPNEEDSKTTYLSHPWVVTDADDSCVGIYMPLSTPTVVLLQ